MKRTEAIANIGWMILQQFPAERREEILADSKRLLEFVGIVRETVDKMHVGAKLNRLSLDDYMAVLKQLTETKGQA